MADRLVVAGSPEIGDQYLARRIQETGQGVFPERVPLVRLLRMLRFPAQHAILWPDVVSENAPLPGGAAARLPILREADRAERERLILDRDWAASVRRCALEALAADPPVGEARMIGLLLAGRRRRTRSTAILAEFGREEVDALRGIPDRARRLTEKRLRTRWTALEAARAALQEARSDALSITGPLANPDGGRGGRLPDRTARAAQRVLEAEERVRRLEAWQRVFDRVDDDFPADEVAGAILRRWLCDVKADPGDRGGPASTLRDIEREYQLSRSTVMLYKDAIIDRAAWYAAEAGLTQEGGEPGA